MCVCVFFWLPGRLLERTVRRSQRVRTQQVLVPVCEPTGPTTVAAVEEEEAEPSVHESRESGGDNDHRHSRTGRSARIRNQNRRRLA